MKGEIAEILVEEPSMKHFLQGILPGILPKGYILNSNCFIRAHQGKQDLRKSIPKKAGAYQKYSVPIRLIVIHDQDSADCILLKKELRDLIISNSTITHLIRIACRELEAWYLGDLDALQAVYPRFKAEKYKNRKLFRNPDECQASHEIKKLIPDFQKIYTAREITKHLSINSNKSSSFQNLISGIQKFLG